MMILLHSGWNLVYGLDKGAWSSTTGIDASFGYLD